MDWFQSLVVQMVIACPRILVSIISLPYAQSQAWLTQSLET